MTALTIGMYGSEFRPTSGAFGLRCGQMRPTTHICITCGLNPSWRSRIQGPVQKVGEKERAPTASCECNLPRRQCEKVTHNSSWFNSKGEKLGWGDLCTCDLERLQKECGETFYILSESDSYWDLHQQIQDGKMPEDATLSHPGVAYVREHASWVVKGGKVFHPWSRWSDNEAIPEDRTKSIGNLLVYTQIDRTRMTHHGI